MSGDHWLAEVLDWFDQVDQYLPGSSNIVGELLYGKVPQANDDRLHDLADAWAAARDHVSSYATDIYRAADPILQGWGGDGAAMNFQQNWQQYIEEVQQAVDAYSNMADMTSGFALEIETEKFMTALNLLFLAYSLIVVIATLAISFGGSALAAPGAFAVAREAIALSAREALERIANLGTTLFTRDVLKNIVARNVADKIASQVFKDVIRKEMRRALTQAVDKAARKALIRGAYQMRKELAEKLTEDLVGKWTGKIVEDEVGHVVMKDITDDAIDKIIADNVKGTFGKELFKYFAPKVAQGAIFMGGQDLVVQTFEVIAGDKSGIDFGEAVTSAVQGGVMGGLMGGRSYAGQMASGAVAGLSTAALADSIAVLSGNGADVNWGADLLHGAGSGAVMAGFFHVQHGTDGFRESLSISVNDALGQKTHLLADSGAGITGLDVKVGDLHIDRQLGGITVVDRGGTTALFGPEGKSITADQAADLGYRGDGGGTIASARPGSSAPGGTSARDTGTGTSTKEDAANRGTSNRGTSSEPPPPPPPGEHADIVDLSDSADHDGSTSTGADVADHPTPEPLATPTPRVAVPSGGDRPPGEFGPPAADRAEPGQANGAPDRGIAPPGRTADLDSGAGPRDVASPPPDATARPDVHATPPPDAAGRPDARTTPPADVTASPDARTTPPSNVSARPDSHTTPPADTRPPGDSSGGGSGGHPRGDVPRPDEPSQRPGGDTGSMPEQRDGTTAGPEQRDGTPTVPEQRDGTLTAPEQRDGAEPVPERDAAEPVAPVPSVPVVDPSRVRFADPPAQRPTEATGERIPSDRPADGTGAPRDPRPPADPRARDQDPVADRPEEQAPVADPHEETAPGTHDADSGLTSVHDDHRLGEHPSEHPGEHPGERQSEHPGEHPSEHPGEHQSERSGGDPVPEPVHQRVPGAVLPVEVTDGGRVWTSELPADLTRPGDPAAREALDRHVDAVLRTAGEPHNWTDGRPPRIELHAEEGIDAQTARHIEHMRTEFDHRNADGTPVRQPRVSVVGPRLHGDPMHLHPEIRGQDGRDGVPYLDAQARARYEVHVVNGRMYDQNDIPLHGHYVFVTEPRTERVYAMEWAEEGRLGAKHSTLLAGGDVLSAGEMKVENGRVVALDNNSGHYRPTAAHVWTQRDVLAGKGIDVSGAEVRVVGHDVTPHSMARGEAAFHDALDELNRPGEIDGVRRIELAPTGRDADPDHIDATLRVTTVDGRVVEIDVGNVHDYLTSTRPDGPDIHRFENDRRPSTPDEDLAHQAADLLRDRIETAVPTEPEMPTDPMDADVAGPPRALVDLDNALAGRLGEAPLLEGGDRATEPLANPDAAVGAARALSDAQIHADVDAAGLPDDQAASLKAALIERRDAVIHQYERAPHPEEVERMTDSVKLYMHPNMSDRELYDVLREEAYRKTAGFSTGLTVHEAARALDEAAAERGEPGGYAHRIDDYLSSPEGAEHHDDVVHLDLATGNARYVDPEGSRFHEPDSEAAADAGARQARDWSSAQREALEQYAAHDRSADHFLRTDGEDGLSGRAEAFKIQSAMRPTDIDVRMHGGLDLRELGLSDSSGLAGLVDSNISVKRFLRVSADEFSTFVQGDVHVVVDAPAGTHGVWLGEAGEGGTRDLLLAAGSDLHVVELTRLGADRYELRVRVDGYEDPAGLTGRLNHLVPPEAHVHEGGHPHDDGHLHRDSDAGRSNEDVWHNGGDVPQTIEEVYQVADLMGIDLSDVRVDLVTDADQIRDFDERGLAATTPIEADGTVIRLGPAAFADRETLAATVAHEYTHVEQLRSGVRVTRENREALEREAYASERPALDRLRARVEDGAHDDPVLGGEGVRPREPGRTPGVGLDPGGRDRAGHDVGGRDGRPDDGAGPGLRESGGPADRADDPAAGEDRTEPGDARNGVGGRGGSHETDQVRVLRDLRDSGADPAGAERDVRRGDPRTPEDGAVQPVPADMELQSGGGREVPVRHGTSGAGPADLAEGSREDRPGSAGHPAAERGGTASDDAGRRGGGEQLDGRPPADVRDLARPIDGSTADHGDGSSARELERRGLTDLHENDRGAIEAKVGPETRELADNVLGELRAIGEQHGGRLVGEANHVKSAESLARKFAAVKDTQTVDEFLDSVNDAIRFSMEMPEDGYGPRILSVLHELDARGYHGEHGGSVMDEVGNSKNFWRRGNRFYGLNMTLQEPDGHLFELQFPTEQSWAAGKHTHEWYEVVRQDKFTFDTRVDAFLRILKINRDFGLPEHVPDDQAGLPIARTSGFAEWVGPTSSRWQSYVDSLAAEGRTFDDVVADHGLARDDIPRADTMGLFDDTATVDAGEVDAGRVGAPAPELAAPEATAPELAAPELAATELAATELAAPEATAPELAAPEVVPPELAEPELVAPEVAAPELAAPDTAAPDTAAPDTAGVRPSAEADAGHPVTERAEPVSNDDGRDAAGEQPERPAEDDLGRLFGRRPGDEPEPLGELRPGLDFRTTDVPLREGMPADPNEAFGRLHEQVSHIADEQASLAESLKGDGKYWFAAVYHHVTSFEMQMIDDGHYTYPIMKLQEVVAFDRTFEVNMDRWQHGRFDEVEPNWQVAFREAEQAAERWHALPSLEILGAMLPSMKAHIEFDLPRAIAAVYERFYQANGIPFDAFKPDFDRMQPVFDNASAALLPEIAEATFPGDPGQYALIQHYGFPVIYDVSQARQDSWHRAGLIVAGHESGIYDQFRMQQRIDAYEDNSGVFSRHVVLKIAGRRVFGYDWNRQPGMEDGPAHEAPDVRLPTQDVQQAVDDRIRVHSRALATVVDKLLDDGHSLNVTASLRSSALHERVISTIDELARGDALKPYDGKLPAFLAEHPGTGPLFEHMAPEINKVIGADGTERTRLSVYVEQTKPSDAALTTGARPAAGETAAIEDYAHRLQDVVEPAVQREVDSIAAQIRGEAHGPVVVSSRPKDAAGLIDKVNRMVAGRPGAPGRPDFQVGDIVDAVGVRITVPDMHTLERVYAAVVDHFGTGDGGRIVEIDNMYASPKAKNPGYRVIPMVVTIEVEGRPYAFELQLTSMRASVAADIEHNALYKPYIDVSRSERAAIIRAFHEAAALDQQEVSDD